MEQAQQAQQQHHHHPFEQHGIAAGLREDTVTAAHDTMEFNYTPQQYHQQPQQQHTTQLVAPRPLKVRRHQKSIISLENFFAGSSGGMSDSMYQPASHGHGHGHHQRQVSTDFQDFGDVIPFPSMDTTTSSSRHYHHHREMLSPRNSMQGRRSRKSSLLDNWELQNIRLGGANLIGQPDVSVFMPTTTSAGDESSADSQQQGGRHSAALEDQPDFQPMQIYSPRQDAVSELFQIMKHTHLGSGSGGDSSAPSTPLYQQQQQHYFEFPPQQQQLPQHGGWADFVPPSPVARTTRNPITLNTAFQDSEHQG